MASSWGRKETIIWPPHVPVYSFTALALAVLATLGCVWYRLNVSLTLLERSYIGDYALSRAGSWFDAGNRFRLIYVGPGGNAIPRPRLALPVDFTDGGPDDAARKQKPVVLSPLARAMGYRTYFRGAEVKLADASVHRWLRGAIYQGRGLLQLFQWSFLEGGLFLAALLYLTVPRDLQRFKQMKYGRVLRGPVMMTPKEFNRKVYRDRFRLRRRSVDAWNRCAAGVNRCMRVYNRLPYLGAKWGSAWRAKPLAGPPHGIGFKTTGMREMMRIPVLKEAQHFQIMGDTGVGKKAHSRLFRREGWSTRTQRLSV